MGTWHYPWLPMGSKKSVGGWLVQALDLDMQSILYRFRMLMS